MFSLGIPYPDNPRDGIWGELTSQENYCEEDYLQTGLIVELINTLTNISYLLYAWYGLYAYRRDAHFWSKALPYLGIAGVGICSAAFHGTMKLYAQWSDDLSMFFATGIVLHRVMSFDKSLAWSRNYALGLSTVLVAVAIYHCWAIETAAHQLTFIIMVLMVATRVRKLIKHRVSSAALRRRMGEMAKLGTITILTAWALWNIDNMACSYLRQIRRAIGMPWGFLLEFHGWWHILTAVAVYIYFVLVESLTGEDSVEANLEGSPAHAWPVSSWLKQFKET